MSEIKKAVALSDLHLGRDLSYLYSKHSEYASNRKSLSEVLGKIVNPDKNGAIDELIIIGDFLELSLAGHDEVYNDVKYFFQLISEAARFKRIVYIPGNHDHHFWRALGEQVIFFTPILRGNFY